MEKKLYQLVTRVLGVKLNDGTKLAYKGYTSIPQGHNIYHDFSKKKIKSEIEELNKLKVKDDLLFDANYTSGFAPSDVKGIYWANDMVKTNYYMVEKSKEEQLNAGDIITVSNKKYVASQVFPWADYDTIFVVVVPYAGDKKEVKALEPVEEAKEV